VLLAACLDDPPATTADACPISERVLLAAAPAKFDPQPDTYYDFFADGDHLLYTFDPPTDPGRTYWHKQRCSGEPEKFPSLLPGLHHPFTIDTPDGPLLYARDADNNTFVVDRLYDPAADVPRRVLDLPPEATLYFYKSGSRYAWFSEPHGLGAEVSSAAGLGGTTDTYYTHTGDPEVPAAYVGGAIVDVSKLDDRLFVLDDDGSLRTFDPFTGTTTVILEGVRHYDLAPSLDKLIWQAIGDDVAEPVYLRDLETGADVEIAVNDIAAESWGRLDDDQTSVGQWVFTRDAAAAAMLGPEQRLVAAARLDTGAPLTIPEHLSLANGFEHEYALVLPDPEYHVEALWNPLSGEMRELYRGPLDPSILLVEADHADYLLRDPADENFNTLWRVDLTTGQATELLSRFSGNIGRFADGRYLIREGTAVLYQPPLDELGLSFGVKVGDLSIFDPATNLRHRLAADVYGYAIYPDEGVVFLDVYGPDPGVWAVPFPK
jgi:hypothetical protein